MPPMQTASIEASGAVIEQNQEEEKQLEKRPPVPPRVRAHVEKLWQKTNNVPEFTRAVAAYQECQKALYPSWFDRTDPFRGLTPAELKTRETNRNVKVNLCLKNVMQTVAMMAPDDIMVEWQPIPQVGMDGETTDTDKRFAETIKAEIQRHDEEIRWQDIIQSYAMDATSFRIAAMKIYYDANYLGTPVSSNQEDPDIQQNIQRLRVMAEDFARRVFTDQDARYLEMMQLKESLNIEGELETWTGLAIENIPLDCIRVDSTIRDIDRIHRAAWISHDVLMSADELRAKYPYELLPDGTWKGIHPEDLDCLTAGKGSADSLNDKFWATQTAAGAGSGAQTSPESPAQRNRFLVREVHSRADGRIETLVESLEYPAASWSPVRTPACWYPFRFFRFNRVQGTIYGISDVELQRDIQSRINSKKSDEEKARWLSLVRWAYDTQLIDEQEAIKLKDINPGELKGINAQGQKLQDVIMQLRMEYDPESFDTTKDEQDMRQMASVPEQMQGVTGRADFATEIDAAVQGATITSNARMSAFCREMEATNHMKAEILVQELTPEEVKQDLGPGAFWPVVYSDAEGKKLYDEITKQVDAELQMQQQAMQLQSAQMGQPPIAPNPDQTTSARQAAIEAKCMEVFGFPEPVTRETLFRRLRCKVTVAMNAQADRAQQGRSLLQLFETIQAGATAAQAAGKVFDPTFILKMAGHPEWETMFKDDPAQLGAQFLQLSLQNPGAVPPDLAMQIVQMLMPVVQQAQISQAAQAGQPQGSPSSAASAQPAQTAQPGAI